MWKAWSSLVVYKIKRKQKKKRRQFPRGGLDLDGRHCIILNKKQILGTVKTIDV